MCSVFLFQIHADWKKIIDQWLVSFFLNIVQNNWLV